MLSYQWDSQKLAIKIFSRLLQLNIPVWMDIMGGMGENIFASMAQGVEGAAVVCPIMTRNYQTSQNCQMELQYAKDKKRAIVAIKSEEFETSGWLGLITAGLLWTPIMESMNEKTMNEQIDSVLKQLNKNGIQEYKPSSESMFQALHKRVSVHALPSREKKEEKTLKAVLQSLKIEDGCVAKYEASLTKLGVDSLDDIYLLTDNDLQDVDMAPLHRRKLMAWVRDQTTAVK